MGALRKGVAARIRALRKLALLTQQGLADKAGVDGKYLGAVERSEKNVSIEILEKIIRAFGMEPFEFFSFGWEGDPFSQKSDRAILGNLLRGADKDTRKRAVDLVKHLIRASRHKRK